MDGDETGRERSYVAGFKALIFAWLVPPIPATTKARQGVGAQPHLLHFHSLTSTDLKILHLVPNLSDRLRSAISCGILGHENASRAALAQATQAARASAEAGIRSVTVAMTSAWTLRRISFHAMMRHFRDQ